MLAPPISFSHLFPFNMLSSSNPLSLLHDDTSSISGDTETSSLHLLTLLLKCAELISNDDTTTSLSLLTTLLSLSSPFSTPFDRVAAYFSHALHCRLISLSLLSTSPPPNPIKTQLPKFHSIFQTYNSITPFIKFSHFTSNQAIYEALNGHDHVHVIDLDIMQGLQWPGLFHILASRPRKFLSVKVTGFGPDNGLLAQTGQRLAEFADSLGLPFEFNSVEGKVGNLTDLSQLKVNASDVTVVHWMHHGLYDITGSDIGTLRVLTAVRPRLITMVQQDLFYNNNTVSFLGRFVEALHYYSALFDALGEGLGRDSVQRHQVEQQLFGCEIRNILAVGGPKRRRMMEGGDNHEVGPWRDELKRVGFESFSLAGSPAAQASLLLGMFPWRGYTLVEENGCLRLGWKDLPLLTASAWQPSDFNTSNANI